MSILGFNFADGGYEQNSFAGKLDVVRDLEAEGSEYSGFRRESAADIADAGPMAAIAAAVTMALASPVMADQQRVQENLTHLDQTAIASMIVQPKVDLEGDNWRPSEMATTTKFFDNQSNAQEINSAKLDNTEEAIKGLAETHAMLAGAAHDIRVDRYTAQSGGSMNADSNPDAGKPTATGIATGAAIGWGAATVANAVLPGAGAPIQMLSAAVTGVQSAALTFGGDGSSTKYDKPRTKAEARAMQADAGYFSGSSNPYDGTTSGQEMASATPASPSMSAFGDAVKSDPLGDDIQDLKSSQIALLEKAAGKVWAQGVEQTEHHKNALEADEKHTEYVESGGAEFDTHELFRAADKGAMNDVQETALVHAATAENPEIAEKIEKKFELKDLDLSFGGGSAASGPKLA